MANDKKLFRVETRGCGDFSVVSTSFDGAAQAVKEELDSQDYGFSKDRCIMRVEFLMRQSFMSNGKRALCGDKDENHLIIAGDADTEELKRSYEEQLARKAEEVEKLKAKMKDEISRLKDEINKLKANGYKLKAERDIQKAKADELQAVLNTVNPDSLPYIPKREYVLNLRSASEQLAGHGLKGYSKNLMALHNELMAILDKHEPKKE